MFLFVHSLYTPFSEDSDNAGTKVWQSLLNVLILLAVIVVMTFVLVLLYKYECYKVRTEVPSYFACRVHVYFGATVYSRYFVGHSWLVDHVFASSSLLVFLHLSGVCF